MKRVSAGRRSLRRDSSSAHSFDDPSKVDLEFIRKEAKAGRVQGIEEIGPQYEGIALNRTPVLEPFYALAEELDLPVAIHIGLGPPGAQRMWAFLNTGWP